MSSQSQYKRRRRLPRQPKEKVRKRKLPGKNQQPKKVEMEKLRTSTRVITNGPSPIDDQSTFPRSTEAAKATVYNRKLRI